MASGGGGGGVCCASGDRTARGKETTFFLHAARKVACLVCMIFQPSQMYGVTWATFLLLYIVTVSTFKGAVHSHLETCVYSSWKSSVPLDRCEAPVHLEK